MVEIASSHCSLLGEGPLWDSDRNTLCWVDILRGEIHELDTDKNTSRILAVHQLIGTVALCTDGDFLAALKNGIGIIDRQSGDFEKIADPESHLPENRFNDGKCDPQGRFWVGSMSLKEEPNKGSVYMLNSTEGIVKKISNTTISNGMAWSLDEHFFYFIDTPTLQVVAYDYDGIRGEIKNPRVVIRIPEEDGYPDGMTIDAQGMLWIAHWNGWQVTRWNPHTGKKLFALDLPVAKVTSCTFGGKGLTDLYITTAKEGLTEKELEEQPLAGMLLVWKNSGFKGVPSFKYKP